MTKNVRTNSFLIKSRRFKGLIELDMKKLSNKFNSNKCTMTLYRSKYAILGPLFIGNYNYIFSFMDKMILQRFNNYDKYLVIRKILKIFITNV